jgi:hypothetical protein
VRSDPARQTDPFGRYGIVIGNSVRSRPDAAQFYQAADVAMMAAMDFQFERRVIPFDLWTGTNWQPRTLDWGTVGFVPLIRLDVAACSAPGLTPRSAGGVPGILLDPDRLARMNTGPFKIAATILHEWVHASLNDFISRSGDPDVLTLFDRSRGRFKAANGAQMEDRLHELFPNVIEQMMFPTQIGGPR